MTHPYFILSKIIVNLEQQLIEDPVQIAVPGVSQEEITNQMKELLELELVERADIDGKLCYKITDKGKRFCGLLQQGM